MYKLLFLSVGDCTSYVTKVKVSARGLSLLENLLCSSFWILAQLVVLHFARDPRVSKPATTHTHTHTHQILLMFPVPLTSLSFSLEKALIFKGPVIAWNLPGASRLLALFSKRLISNLNYSCKVFLEIPRWDIRGKGHKDWNSADPNDILCEMLNFYYLFICFVLHQVLVVARELFLAALRFL